MAVPTDSPRYCDVCKGYGDHHTGSRALLPSAMMSRSIARQPLSTSWNEWKF
jgi:hypothetical protein